MNLFNYNWVFSQEIISAITTIIIIIITPCLKPNFQHNISNQEYSSDEKRLTHARTHTAAACSSECDVLRKFTGGVESPVTLLE